MNDSSSESIVLIRDCDAVQIPSGVHKVLPKGTSLMITQSFGGSYTVAPQGGGLFSIANKDADALGLQAKTEEPQKIASAGSGPVDEKLIWDQLKTCFDPEIPINIVDLGLIYDLKISPLERERNRVEVKMTLTAPGCGMGTFIAADAQSKILKVPGVAEADVQLVWEPPWNQSMISAEGRTKLGMA